MSRPLGQVRVSAGRGITLRAVRVQSRRGGSELRRTIAQHCRSHRADEPVQAEEHRAIVHVSEKRGIRGFCGSVVLSSSSR